MNRLGYLMVRGNKVYVKPQLNSSDLSFQFRLNQKSVPKKVFCCFEVYFLFLTSKFW
jgi:hypothetical protein